MARTSAHTEVRRSDIRDMIMQGKSTNFIAAWIFNTYGVGRRTVERDITAIYKNLREDFLEEKQEIISKHIMRYENLYCFYMDRGTDKEPNVFFNPELASKMLEKKEKLLQLYNPDVVVNFIGNQQNNVNLNMILSKATTEELLKLKEKYDSDRDSEDK